MYKNVKSEAAFDSVRQYVAVSTQPYRKTREGSPLLLDSLLASRAYCV